METASGGIWGSYVRWRDCAAVITGRGGHRMCADELSGCLACKMGQLGKPGVQARMVRLHPTRRFQIVAMDVLEMSLQTRSGIGRCW
jgi:hypothetical protein